MQSWHLEGNRVNQDIARQLCRNNINIDITIKIDITININITIIIRNSAPSQIKVCWITSQHFLARFNAFITRHSSLRTA